MEIWLWAELVLLTVSGLVGVGLLGWVIWDDVRLRSEDGFGDGHNGDVAEVETDYDAHFI